MSEQERKCSTCMFSQKRLNDYNHLELICRVRSFSGDFPKRKDDDFCYEWCGKDDLTPQETIITLLQRIANPLYVLNRNENDIKIPDQFLH